MIYEIDHCAILTFSKIFEQQFIFLNGNVLVNINLIIGMNENNIPMLNPGFKHETFLKYKY